MKEEKFDANCTASQHLTPTSSSSKSAFESANTKGSVRVTSPTRFSSTISLDRKNARARFTSATAACVLLALMLAMCAFVTGCSGSGASNANSNTNANASATATANNNASANSNGASSNSSSNNTANNSNISSTDGSQGEKISVSVEINATRAESFGYTADMGTYQFSLPANSTVFDALKACGVDYQGDETYIKSINGLAEKSCNSSQSGWMYSVNGEYPEKTCGQYTLKEGDKVKWEFWV